MPWNELSQVWDTMPKAMLRRNGYELGRSATYVHTNFMVEPINFMVEPINFMVEPINFRVEPIHLSLALKKNQLHGRPNQLHGRIKVSAVRNLKIFLRIGRRTSLKIRRAFRPLAFLIGQKTEALKHRPKPQTLWVRALALGGGLEGLFPCRVGRVVLNYFGVGFKGST